MATLTLKKGRTPASPVAVATAAPLSAPIRLTAEQERDAFKASTKLADMLEALDVPTPLAFDRDGFGMYFDALREKVGWQAYTARDIGLFFELISDRESSAVKAGTLTEFDEETHGVEGYSFEHTSGVHVAVTYGGLNPSVYIRNKAATK